MRLTHARAETALEVARHTRAALPRPWAYVAIVCTLLPIFELDRVTASAPLQHLYYLPIILASYLVGRPAGLIVSIAAVLLYHFANPVLFTAAYKESDIVQIVLFMAVGIVTATLSENARRLHRLAMTDDLTGLHNLRSFEAHLTGMVRAAREGGVPLAMLALDLDRLKSINDAHGHLAGAEAVRTVGQILAARLPATAVACRYGGDEFAVALPDCAFDEATRIADDLRRAVNTVAPVLAGIRFPVATLSISVGVACLVSDSGIAGLVPVDEAAAGEWLFKAADRALYVAKETGRNRVSA